MVTGETRHKKRIVVKTGELTGTTTREAATKIKTPETGKVVAAAEVLSLSLSFSLPPNDHH
jgi:hypothetical protein